jgi:serpin B
VGIFGAVVPLSVALAVQCGCGGDPTIVPTRFAVISAKPVQAKKAPAQPKPVALPPPHRLTISADADPAPLIKTSNALAFELYAQLRAQPGNLLIAPAPLSLGLCLLRAGARQETADELDRVVHRQEGNLQRWQRGLAAFLVSLNRDSRPSRSGEPQPEMQSYQIRLADGLWVQSGYSIRNEYQSLLADQFGVDDMHVDFRGDPASACSRINQWTAARTGGRISEVIFPESIIPATKLVMSICLYLRATWRTPFLEEGTQDQPFRISRTEAKQVPMMQMHTYTKEFAYWEDGTMQILEMSSAGGDCGFLILLPKTWDGLVRLERSLKPELIEIFLKDKREPEELDIRVPRFRFASRFSLKQALAGLGIRRVFDRATADFSGINGQSNDLFLYDVVHADMIDVDEKGLEAAAAVEFISADAFGDEPVSFHADHPFVFLVRDNRTGCILFLGRLTDPAPPADLASTKR